MANIYAILAPVLEIDSEVKLTLKLYLMKTSQIISTAIIFTLTSTSFANGGDDLSKTITENSNSLTLTIIDVNNPSCNGGSNGSATALAKGGQAPYTYNWNTFPNQTTAQASNLSQGTYFVQVVDASGDVFFKTVYLEDPNASILTQIESVSAELDLTATVSGENAPYTYQLNGNPTNSKEINHLPVGIHELVITDANECEMMQYIQVFEVQSLPNGSNSNEGSPIIKNDNENQEQMKSKKDRHLEASKLIPTIINNEDQFEENLVTVSSH
jgi:SprB repeat